jgi:hypothetical protein
MPTFRSKLTALALVAFIGAGPAASAEQRAATDFDHALVARTALEKHIRPGFRRLTSAFTELQQATGSCEKQPQFRYARLRPVFRKAVLAWGRVAHLNFGPLAAENRYDRVFFWLDRKGIARRQVARALKESPSEYRDAAKLAQSSIGVQGLPALEQLIATPAEPGENSSFRCSYAQAIAGNLVNIAREVEAAWSEGGIWSERWLTPGPGNPTYIQPSETTYALIRAYLDNIERVRDVELMRPLGLAVRGRDLPGPFARSDLTMAFIGARITGLRSLIEDGGLAKETTRTAKARGSPAAEQAMKQVRFELRLLTRLSTPLTKVPDFFGSSQRDEAIALGFPLKSARFQAERAFSLTTDLPMGFNASDGD